MTYTNVKEIKVALDFGTSHLHVGRLAIRDGKIYFEYDADFIKSGLQISPYRLPLKAGLTRFEASIFEGLNGVFNDSLPDGWGRLLNDRAMRSQGIMPQELSPLDRLANVGKNGVGALVYEPDISDHTVDIECDLDKTAQDAADILNGNSDDFILELLARNGSSQGARPKVMIGVNPARDTLLSDALSLPDGFDHWMVKFPNSSDGSDAGAIEYVYSIMANQAGLSMEKTHLFPSKKSVGFFATKRFDRNGTQRFHAHTACGILHSDFRTPSLDYSDLMTLTRALTRDVREAYKMFRIGVFNVLSHNRDDHSKNFSFLMNEQGEWKLAPAYDLTFSAGPNGEQSTSLMGEGRKPSVQHLIALGKEAGLDDALVKQIIEQARSALSSWQGLATEYGVSKANIALINGRIGS
jgi:serine/threonine-protein kinase HipA